MGSIVHDSRAAMDSRHCSCSYAAPRLSSFAASRGRARRGVAPRLRSAGCLPQPQQPLCVEGAASGVIAPLSSLSSGPAVDEAVWDVLGLGQAMVDFAATVNDDTLAELSVEKGCRRVISVGERGAVLQALDGSSYQINAGGSLANSIVALARLGAAHGKAMGRPLRVAMAGCIGDDPLGHFFREQMRIAGVSFVTEASPGTATGTVVVLTTPDANRTFLSYLGTPEEIKLREALREAISRSRMMVVEGYLWEMPNALQSIQQAIEVAQEAGTLVALTAGDPSLVERQRDNLWAAIDAGADLLFMNASEARALLGQEGITAQEAAQQLSSKCPLVVVTDGSKGSYVTGMGHLHVVPPHWSPHAPVDTCGAGDAYAAGILYALLCGFDLTATGNVAARVASKVISRHGAQLTDEDAADIAALMPSTPGEGIGSPPPPPPQQSHVLGTVAL